MSPSHPPKDIRVRVPRHNAQRVGPALSAQIAAAALAEDGPGVPADVRQGIQHAREPGSELVRAVESASEWNSLLATARAERGPQWDVATQMYVCSGYIAAVVCRECGSGRR
jgi:Tfp pilus assembly protein PilW